MASHPDVVGNHNSLDFTRASMNSVEYNEGIAKKWFAERAIDATVPPVEKQVETIPINCGQLFSYPFNPSIIQFGDRRLMVYRHRHDGIHSILSIAEFDSSFHVITNKRVTLNESTSQEDARLFEHDGKLWMSWVSTRFPDNSPACVTKYGQLVEGLAWKASEWIVENIEQPEYGKNDWSAMEKNWVPFSFGGEIHFIYAHGEVIVKVDGRWAPYSNAQVLVGWRYGQIKGGTRPMPFKGKWLRFAHSTLDNEPGKVMRRYYVLAIVMEPTPPFSVIQISKEPIIRGSETCKVNPENYPQFNPKVLFPSGAIPYQDGWLLSVGVNDAEIVLAKILESNLKL